MINEAVRFGELDQWEDIPEVLRKRSTLVLGNGASRAVWDKFGYNSLYEEACNCVPNPLSDQSKSFFKSLNDTTNFEQVLGLLSGAQLVVTNLKMPDAGEIRACYENVRDALVEAVHAVHVPWSDALRQNLDVIQRELQNYRRVFTTNYDLIPYWMLMQNAGPRLFKDFFGPGGRFDPSLPVGDYIPIYYLHGGLHLFRTPDGFTRKHLSDTEHNLLSRFSESFEDGNRPLFVSEGTSTDKLLSIRDSDYLRFALRALQLGAPEQGQQAGGTPPTVFFGHSLTPEYDQHLLNALQPNLFRKVAVSVHPKQDPKRIAKIQADLIDQAKAWDFRFFNSETHPLGRPDLQLYKPPAQGRTTS